MDSQKVFELLQAVAKLRSAIDAVNLATLVAIFHNVLANFEFHQFYKTELKESQAEVDSSCWRCSTLSWSVKEALLQLSIAEKTFWLSLKSEHA